MTLKPDIGVKALISCLKIDVRDDTPPVFHGSDEKDCRDVDLSAKKGMDYASELMKKYFLKDS